MDFDEMEDVFGAEIAELLKKGGLDTIDLVRKFAQEGRLQEVDGIADAREAEILDALEVEDELDAEEMDDVTPEALPQPGAETDEAETDEAEAVVVVIPVEGDEPQEFEVPAPVAERLNNLSAGLDEVKAEVAEMRDHVGKLSDQSGILKQIIGYAESNLPGHSLNPRQVEAIREDIIALAKKGVV